MKSQVAAVMHYPASDLPPSAIPATCCVLSIQFLASILRLLLLLVDEDVKPLYIGRRSEIASLCNHCLGLSTVVGYHRPLPGLQLEKKINFHTD